MRANEFSGDNYPHDVFETYLEAVRVAFRGRDVEVDPGYDQPLMGQDEEGLDVYHPYLVIRTLSHEVRPPAFIETRVSPYGNSYIYLTNDARWNPNYSGELPKEERVALLEFKSTLESALLQARRELREKEARRELMDTISGRGAPSPQETQLLLNGDAIALENFLYQYTQKAPYEDFPTEKGKITLQRAGHKRIVNGRLYLECQAHYAVLSDSGQSETFQPVGAGIEFEIFPLPPARIEFVARCIQPACLGYYSALLDEVKKRFPPERANTAEQRTSGDLSKDRPDTGQPRGAGENTLKKDGEVWSITYEGKTSHVPTVKGLDYIAYLLRYPDKDCHVLDLVRAVEGTLQEATQLDESERDFFIAEDDTTPQEIVDDEYKHSIEARIKELAEERQKANEAEDEERLNRIDDEVEKLTEEWSKATALGGRSRVFSDKTDKERVRVTRLISTALDKISDVDESLATHLADSITKGARFKYAPKSPNRWDT